MPMFRPASLLPTPATGARPVPPAVVPPPAQTPSSTGDALTLDALMARQKQAAQMQGQAMQQPVQNIPQGLSQMAWTLVNALQERRAGKELAQGQQDVAQAMGSMDPTTGALPPDAMQTLWQRDPATAMEMVKTAMALRATQAKTENWESIPTPQGETGQWFKNATTGETKKVGGSTDTSTWKPTDIGSLRDDYTKAATTYETAAPSWQSMQDAAKVAIGNTGPNVGSADLNLVVGLAKILDPNSVVREGESESVKKTGGAADYLVSYYNQLVQGGQLTDDIRKGIMNTGQSRMKAYYDQAKGKRDWISGIATRHQVNPDDVVPPLAGFTPWSEQPPPDDPNNPDPNKKPDVVTDPDISDFEGKPTTEPEGTEGLSDNGTHYIVRGGKWVRK